VDDGIRVLVASAIAAVVVPPLTQALHGTVVAATGPIDLRREIAERVRFDVVLADLTWNAPELEYRFDGFDVLEMLREYGRSAPVVFAAQGLRVEQDYIDEVPAHPEIAGLLHKSAGLGPVIAAVRLAGHGRRLPEREFPVGARTDGNDLHGYFGRGRKGNTAARMAGAVASGRVCDARSLQAATGIPLNTVNKLATYLAPLIQARREVPGKLPVTAPVVYRWCGEHAHYLLSWCRRNGHADVASRVVQ
jgi:hypothetical protein